MPMVMYMSLMELVKAEVEVPRLMRKPPIITTGRWPKRLHSMVATGAAVGEKGHDSVGLFPSSLHSSIPYSFATATSYFSFIISM